MKKRRDCYFGLHFDLHAHPDTCHAPLGESLTEEHIREICRTVKPDFLQIDCKGHPGWASYPSALENAMPHFKGDPLALWRRVTAEEGVALYVHYSGVVDRRYCDTHPDQRVIQEDGTPHPETTRTFGSYADDLLIPQMTELYEKYGINGAWIDGECWGTRADFHPDTVAAFEKETGIALGGSLPTSPDHPAYHAYREFCRELFRRYVRHYTDTLHARCPGFEIASNWAFSDHMPEAPTANVDFISGDLNPADSFRSARYAGRAIAQQGRPWDLMSWNFRINGAFLPKHPVQVMQEAAAVISLGGGFQHYITQYKDISPRMEQIRRMAPVADFVRARQPFCFGGRAHHQVALLLSSYDRGRESELLYSRNGYEKIMGLTSLLCDIGHSTEIVSEHTLAGHYADYPVIVVPETYAGLADETIKELLAYAEAGGSLLLVGPHTCDIFAAAGAPFTLGEPQNDPFFTVDDTGDAAQDLGRAGDCRAVSAAGQTVIAAVYADRLGAPREPLAIVAPYGKGKIAAIGADFGFAYLTKTQYLHQKTVERLLALLYTPSVQRLGAEGALEITDLRLNGRQFIQLVNGNGRHADPTCATESAIPACRDITLSIAAAQKPQALLLQPAGAPLPFVWENGRAVVTVDRVDLHEIIEVVE